MGTAPLCARQAWRALLRKRRCGEGGGLSLPRQCPQASSCAGAAPGSQSELPTPFPPHPALPTHCQKVQGPREVGLHSQCSGHVDLSQRGRGHSVPRTFRQVQRAQRQVGSSEAPASVLPWEVDGA